MLSDKDLIIFEENETCDLLINFDSSQESHTLSIKSINKFLISESSFIHKSGSITKLWQPEESVAESSSP